MLHVIFHFQSYIVATLVNPQKCLPYFTFQLPIYEGDDYSKVVDRLRRANQIPGILRMYEVFVCLNACSWCYHLVAL